jgi:hypothetical protein
MPFLGQAAGCHQVLALNWSAFFVTKKESVGFFWVSTGFFPHGTVEFCGSAARSLARSGSKDLRTSNRTTIRFSAAPDGRLHNLVCLRNHQKNSQNHMLTRTAVVQDSRIQVIVRLNRSAHVPFIDSDVCFFCLPKTREKAQNRFAVPDGCFLQRFGTQLTMAA